MTFWEVLSNESLTGGCMWNTKGTFKLKIKKAIHTIENFEKIFEWTKKMLKRRLLKI